jgi:glycosyltransferase involved in cell wall biosynthesis
LKKVLIITYYWPPSGGAGVQRWLKFSKYLPDYGWEPVILTVDPDYAFYPQKDIGLLNDVPPGLEVIYTKAPTRVSFFYKLLTGKKEIPYGGFVNETNPGLIQRIFRFIRGNFFLPDARVGWNRFAVKRGLEIVKRKEIDTIITTSPPHSTQLIGLKIKQKLNIRWIADLRDPWTDIYYSGMMYQMFPAKKINRSLELKVLNSADRVIATCNSTRDLFRSKLAKYKPAENILTITNGFDDEDYANLENVIPGRFVITYLGTFAHNYDIDVLLQALENHASGATTKVTLCFIGKIDEDIACYLKNQQFISLEIIPYVEHKKALGYLAGSSALLIVIPSRNKAEEMIPAKLFEYMASKRPIIAIGPRDGDVAEILRITNSGRIFEKEDFKELGDYISELDEKFKNGEFEINSISTEKYSRKNLSKEIASVLDSIS